MENTSPPRIDRSAFSVVKLSEADGQYWLGKTQLERLEAMELIRQVIYG